MDRNQVEQYVDTKYGQVEPDIGGLCRLPGDVLKILFESYGLKHNDAPNIFIPNILALETHLSREYSQDFARQWIRKVLIEYHEQNGV